MLVTGDPLRSPGPRGEQQWDSSFLIWLNAEGDAVKVTMPTEGGSATAQVVVSTCPDHPVGNRRRAGRVPDPGRPAPWSSSVNADPAHVDAVER